MYIRANSSFLSTLVRVVEFSSSMGKFRRCCSERLKSLSGGGGFFFLPHGLCVCVCVCVCALCMHVCVCVCVCVCIVHACVCVDTSLRLV